jgi:hypothetical protein
MSCMQFKGIVVLTLLPDHAMPKVVCDLVHCRTTIYE